MQVWGAGEYEAFILWISRHPDAGDVIPGTAGIRKVRWSRSGMGKQGGARVIYFIRNRSEVALLLVYAKARFDNLSSDYLRRLKEEFDGS